MAFPYASSLHNRQTRNGNYLPRHSYHFQHPQSPQQQHKHRKQPLSMVHNHHSLTINGILAQDDSALNSVSSPPSSSSSTPSDNMFSFESPSSSSVNTPNTSVFDFEQKNNTNAKLSNKSRDSLLENDITDIIDGYATEVATPQYDRTIETFNDSQISSDDEQWTLTSSSRAPVSSIKRARRQSSVYQDVISMISEEEYQNFSNSDIHDKKRKVVSIDNASLQSFDEDQEQIMQGEPHSVIYQQQHPTIYEQQPVQFNTPYPVAQSNNEEPSQSLPRRYNTCASLINQSKLSVNMLETHKQHPVNRTGGFSCIFRTNSTRTQDIENSFNNRSSVYTHLVTNGLRPSESAKDSIGTDFYKLSSQDYQGNHFEFSELADKVVLVVNISFYGKLASKNLKYLNYLHEKYSAKGLVIIGFPCKQFNITRKNNSVPEVQSFNGNEQSVPSLHKRSVSLSDISSRMQHERQFSAPVHARTTSNTSIFSPLNNSCNSDLSVEELIATYDIKFPIFSEVKVNGKNSCPIYSYLKNEKNGVLGTKFIKWNFEKFIIDKYGNVHKRFSCLKNMKQIEQVINNLLDDTGVLIDSCHSLVGFNENMFD